MDSNTEDGKPESKKLKQGKQNKFKKKYSLFINISQSKTR